MKLIIDIMRRREGKRGQVHTDYSASTTSSGEKYSNNTTAKFIEQI
jgi:hypothetical protein